MTEAKEKKLPPKGKKNKANEESAGPAPKMRKTTNKTVLATIPQLPIDIWIEIIKNVLFADIMRISTVSQVVCCWVVCMVMLADLQRSGI